MDQKQYEQALSRALDDIAVIATRHGINSKHLIIKFDVGREPARYNEHTISIAIRDTDIAVQVQDVPHHWLTVGTGFVDTRLSRRIGPVLLQLAQKADAAGFALG